MDGQKNAALLCVFERIVQQIDEDLPDADLIREEPPRNAGIDIYTEIQTLFAGAVFGHAYKVKYHGPDIVGDRNDLHFSGFNLRHIQNVIDHRQKDLGGGLNIVRILRDILGNILAEDHLVQADDRIDRRADFMAHAGKEAVLHTVERFYFAALLQRLIHGFAKHRDLEAEHEAEHSPYDQDGEQRVHIGRAHGMCGHKAGITGSKSIAQGGDQSAHSDQDELSSPVHGQIDKKGAENKPDRRTSQYPSSRKKSHRQKDEYDDPRDDGSGQIDP